MEFDYTKPAFQQGATAALTGASRHVARGIFA